MEADRNMESETETRPLLPTFENDTWRTRARRRCLRIPSELTITGIILGLFLVVVTLLIVFENLQSTEKDELRIDDTLLASPFKYNKKAQDQMWQDKKDFVKNQQQNGFKSNKGGKIVPDPKDSSDTNTVKDLDFNDSEIKSMLLTSKIKWKDEDEGWKKLYEQGWKDKDIRNALLKALKEKEGAQMEDTLQYSMNYDQFWQKINENWKKNIHKGDNEIEKQKNINDEWKNKMNKKEGMEQNELKDNMDKKSEQKNINNEWKDKVNKKADEQENVNNEWKDKVNQKADEQETINNEWLDKMHVFQAPSDEKVENVEEEGKAVPENEIKDKDMEEALVNAWKVKATSLKSPLNFQDLLGKAKSMLQNLLKDGMDKQGSYKNSYTKEKSTKEMYVLQSADSQNKSQSYDVSEILSELGLENLKIDIIDGVEFGKLLITVIETIKDLQKEQRMTGEVDKESKVQSSMSLDNIKWKTVDDGWKTLTDQGWKDKEIKEALYKAWKDSHKLLQSAMGYNNMKWKKVDDGWKKIDYKSVEVSTRCPFKHSPLTLSADTPRIDCALITEEVRKQFGKCIDLSFLPKECKPAWRTKCFSSYKYRKIDGTCNNKIHPTWGKSLTPFVRMLAPEYGDGVSTFRKAKSGDPLPNPRDLSRKLYSKKIRPDSHVSVLFLYFGLFVDHDMAETGLDIRDIPCCNEEFVKYPDTKPKECLEIHIPKDDPFYGPKNVTCLNLLRSTPVNGECGGRREQMNKVTAFIDGSAIYGSEIKVTKQLREFSRGQLKTQIINNTPFMSYNEGAAAKCGTLEEPLKCFEAGDVRANMMVELASMHILWYREHNRLAFELSKLNPHWTDEILFQEARRILIGELQHITYNEFLPELLGEKAMEVYELKLEKSKIYEGYDDTVDPSLFNIFATSAFRFGHSLVPDSQMLGDNSTKKVYLHDTFFNNVILIHNGLDLLVKGAATQRTQSVDSYISKEAREHLFQEAKLDYGNDLAALGIQRGRDHGIPPYLKTRAACGLSEIKTWDDLYLHMHKERADFLKNAYESIEDIDLTPGGLAENHVDGALVGPTYHCIMARQFKKTRKGDRFWFEIQNEIGSFTKDQLDEIYKSSMARIVCDNSNNIKRMQKHSLIVPSAKNPVIDCDAIPKVDLTRWLSKN